MVKEKIKKLLDNRKNNIIITGPNMGGKSKILLELLKVEKNKKKYFISCNNRNIAILDEGRNRLNGNEENFYVEKIVNKRIEFLDKGIDKDVLGKGNSENVSEEMLEYFLENYKNEDFVKKFDEFIEKFDIKIKVVDESKNYQNEIDREIEKLNFEKNKIEKILEEKMEEYTETEKTKIREHIEIEKMISELLDKKNDKINIKKLIGEKNGKDVELSTGIRALIRLFIEIWIANKKEIKMVYIDEVDMHIDQKNSVKLLEAIYEAFPQIRFCTVAHNMFVISGVKDNIIISLDGSESLKFFDSNDYLDLRAISNDIFEIERFEKVKEKSNIERKIDDLYNKIFETGKITEDFIKEYNQIKENEEIKKISPAYNDTLKLIQELIEKYGDNKGKNEI